jgi:flavin reductase (DIM6/NTAB) family NADH-FMN oxidoreductase RutF
LARLTPQDLWLRPLSIFDAQWALLVGGSARPNPMTVSWGGLGTLWNRPVATVYVRPTRYTFTLLEAEPFFTLNFLPERHRAALDLCGSRSGRDTDKWEATRLTRLAGETVPVPRVGEAELALECRVLTTLDLDPGRFLDPAIDEMYPRRDYHRLFVGEVMAAFAEEADAPSRA